MVKMPIKLVLIVAVLPWLFLVASASLIGAANSVNLLLGTFAGALVLAAGCGGMASVIEAQAPSKWNEIVPESILGFTLAAGFGSVLMLGCSLAQLSFLLHQTGMAAFAAGTVTFWDVVETYGWFLVKVIPLVDPDITFGFAKPKLQPTGWLCGAPFLMFQAIVVVFLLEALQQAWTRYQTRTSDSLRDRIKAFEHKRVQSEA